MTRQWIYIVLVCAALFAGVLPVMAQFSETTTLLSQQFAQGRLIGRADTGTVWVLADNGRLLQTSATDADVLPVPTMGADAGVQVAPLFASALDMLPTAHTLVGAPVAAATQFDALIGYASNTISIALPEGDTLLLGPGARWTRSVDETPSPPVPALLSFGYSPEAPAAGDVITLDWAAEGVTAVDIDLLAARGSTPVVALPDQPSVGTGELMLPEDAAGLVALSVYGLPVGATDPVLLTEVSIDVQPSTTLTTTGVYQPFEHGFMLLRSDTTLMYAFYDTGSYTTFAPALVTSLPPNPETEAKAGYILPAEVFGRVWGNDDAVRDGLGYALAPEQPYAMTVTQADDAPLTFSLPDGQQIALDVAGWTSVE